MTTISYSYDIKTSNIKNPKIKKKLSGIYKYGDVIQFKGIEESYYPVNKRITLNFSIPERSRIPADYKAWGHNCFIDINENGKSISIAKRACQTFFLDKNMFTSDDNGNDLVITLK